MQIIKQLADLLQQDESDIKKFLQNAPRKYKVYRIPKRTTGFRIIAQPSKKLKEYQRYFIESYSFPIHKAALAYRKGKSIRDNALAHVNQSYLLKMDFENFFNSITPTFFWHSLTSCTSPIPQFTDVEKSYVEKILFWQPIKRSKNTLMLSVGAPSSPVISNFCLYEFDRRLSQICEEYGVIYTRYADDLTFSTNIKNLLPKFPSIIHSLLHELFNGILKINHAKTVYSSKAHNRHVTGITLNNEGQLSLGREKKRFIKHMINQYKYDALDDEDKNYLCGLLAFSLHIEPEFILRLEKKYTSVLIKKLTGRTHQDER